ISAKPALEGSSELTPVGLLRNNETEWRAATTALEEPKAGEAGVNSRGLPCRLATGWMPASSIAARGSFRRRFRSAARGLHDTAELVANSTALFGRCLAFLCRPRCIGRAKVRLHSGQARATVTLPGR